MTPREMIQMKYSDRRPPKRIKKMYHRLSHHRYHKKLKLLRLRKLHYWMRNNYIGSHGIWLKQEHAIRPPDYEWRIDGRNHEVRLNLPERTRLDRYSEKRMKDRNVVQ